MADYSKMYYLLCAAASETLDLLPVTAENEAGRRRLEKALLEAEEIYMESDE